MADSRRRDSGDNHHDKSNDADDVSDSSSIESRPVSSSSVENATAGSLRDEIENEPTRIESRLSDPVADVLAAERDGDSLLGESRVLRWLQALDMQVLGACRGDERLKPLLKLNVSNGMAEDRLLSHLSQHFEPAEIGMLARCFCIPLVSVRVGKIKKEGTRMRPTTLRGSLSLMVLPTSDLRLSFTGDNGQSEQLFTYSSKSQCSAVSIEDITADSSGRSFVIRIADGHAFYYWCSEKSKLLGTELRRKMKDLIMKKPSISELTGIEESRLGSVASHLRLYLMGSVVPNIKGFPIPTTSFSLDSSSSSGSSSDSSDSSSGASKSLRARNSGTQVTKASSFHQGSLSPRSSSFKENTLRSSPLRISSKSRRRSEGHFLAFDNLPVASNTNNLENYIQSEGETADENRSGPIIASDVAAEFTPTTMTPLNMGAPVFSPYYCWCPPNTSSLHAPSSTSYQFPPLSIELPALPPLSSLLPLPASGSDGFLIPSSPLDLSDIPPFLPNSLPLVHLPISSSSQQMISTFTPLMCDPIVHIPVIDICSSGQGYLVSAGPGISTNIPPLLPQLVTPVGLPQNDSLVEKGARETLRLLISGANSTTAAPMNQGILVAGNRGLYSGARDSMRLFAPAGMTRTGDGGGGDGRVDGGESGASSGEAMHLPPRESSG